MWSAVNAWKEINSETLKNAWHHLLLTIMFNDENKDDKCDFKGFPISKKESIIFELLEYTKIEMCSWIREI